ncbi:MAG: DinB family protein [Acidobacteria bacterium]|nr:DinB family protein [Acidobacteriota bacterium]
MPTPTPYAEYVAGHDPLTVLTTSLEGYRAVFARTSPEQWQTPWAPGKWTRHQVLVHVTQWELIFSTRVRMALAIPDYTVQPLEQDALLEIEAPLVDVATATAAFDALRVMNIALIAGLSKELRARVIGHPERGQIDIEDLIVTLAGHAVHHLKQIED